MHKLFPRSPDRSGYNLELRWYRDRWQNRFLLHKICFQFIYSTFYSKIWTQSYQTPQLIWEFLHRQKDYYLDIVFHVLWHFGRVFEAPQGQQGFYLDIVCRLVHFQGWPQTLNAICSVSDTFLTLPIWIWRQYQSPNNEEVSRCSRRHWLIKYAVI